MGKIKGYLTKEEFENLLIQSGLSKEEFAELIGTNKKTVANWGTKGKEPPYWVESWLKNYIAAKSAKLDVAFAPIVDWYDAYKSLVGRGMADDMHIFFKRGCDMLVEDQRTATVKINAIIMKQGVVVEASEIGTLFYRLKKELVEKASKAGGGRRYDLPLYSDDTPDAK